MALNGYHFEFSNTISSDLMKQKPIHEYFYYQI